MSWDELFSKGEMPTLTQIDDYVNNPLWLDFRAHIETQYATKSAVEYSGCGGAPGWNVKYKKSGRALCTLYPAEGFFTCLVSIGSREADEAELLLNGCTDEVRAVLAV